MTKQYRGKDVIDIFELIINTKVQGIYWFFIPLFATYLSIPIFGFIDKSDRRNVYSYVVGLSLMFVATIPLVCKLLNFNYNYGLTPYVSSGYLIYVLLGYLLVNCYQFTLKQRRIIYLIGTIGLFSRLLTVMFWSLEAGKIVNVLGGYTALPTVAYSIAVFVFFQYDLEKVVNIESLRKFDLSQIAGYGFGVYLLHMFFVIGLPRMFQFSNHSIWWRTVGVLVVYGLCVISVMIFKKIPFLKKVV